VLVTANKSYDYPSSYFVRVLSVLKSIFQINSKLIFTAIFCLITSISYAADSTATKSQTSQSNQKSSPEWVYKELSSIQKEVSVLDATGATKDSVQALKERLTKVEVQLEQSQLRVDDSLKVYGNRIEDIYASTDRFSYIAAWLGAIASILAVMFGWISAGRKAQSEAKKHVDTWLEGNEANLTEQLEKAKNRLNETLENEIVSAKKQIKTLIAESKGNIDLIQSDVTGLKDNVKDAVISSLKNDGYTLPKEEKDKAIIEAKNISNKSDKDKTAMDWRTLAIEHYFSNDYIEALNSINKAFKQENIKKSFSSYEEVDTYFLKGSVLIKLNRLADAVVIYSDLVTQFGGIKDLKFQHIVAKALRNLGLNLNALNRSEEALDVYTDVVKRFGENKDLELQEQVASALINKGITLSELKRTEQELDTYSDIERRFGESENVLLQEKVAKSMNNKAIVLFELKRPEDALNVYTDVVKRFGESKNPVLQDRVASSLLNKGVMLGKLEYLEDELKVYSEIMKRFNESKALIHQEIIAKALNYRAIALGQLNRLKEAVDVYAEVVKRFGESKELMFQEQVASALINKGITLGELKLPEEATEAYSEVVKRFGESKEPSLQVFVNKAKLKSH